VTMCERHHGRCVYRGDEPDRCAHCLRMWKVIASDSTPGHGAAQSVAERPHVHPPVCRCPDDDGSAP
jgi:hypothetical protein